jgi:hypothetical protein
VPFLRRLSRRRHVLPHSKKERDMSGFDLINEPLRPASFAVGNEKKTKPRLTIMEGNDEFVWRMSHFRFAEWRGNVTEGSTQLPRYRIRTRTFQSS